MADYKIRVLPAAVRVLELAPPVKRVLGVALPDAPSDEASRFARYLRQRFACQAP